MGLVENVAREMAREIGAKTREFYEFVLPPIDMIIRDQSVIITADMPGFEKKDIDVTLRGRILHIKACRQRDAQLDAASDGNSKEKGDDGGDDGNGRGYEEIICAQRPSFIDKKIRLPVVVYGATKREDNSGNDNAAQNRPSAKYENGMLEVAIPTRKRGGIDIPIK